MYLLELKVFSHSFIRFISPLSSKGLKPIARYCKSICFVNEFLTVGKQKGRKGCSILSFYLAWESNNPAFWAFCMDDLTAGINGGRIILKNFQLCLFLLSKADTAVFVKKCSYKTISDLNDIVIILFVHSNKKWLVQHYKSGHIQIIQLMEKFIFQNKSIKVKQIY